MKIRVWRRSANIVETVGLEDYLTNVLPREVFPSWPQGALKANAIMARTWAYYYIQNPKYPSVGADVCDTTASQVYDPERADPRTTQAIRDTDGVVMVDTHSGKVFPTFYSASCGGSGETAWDVRHIVGHTNCPCGGKHKRYGHGHGGCQWGTYYLARDANSYEDILKFYFKNFSLLSNYGNEKESTQSFEEFLASVETHEMLGKKFLVWNG